MNQTDWIAILSSWQFSPLVLLSLILAATIYLRGWCRYRAKASGKPGDRRAVAVFSVDRAAAFIAGLMVIFVALQSPLDVLAGFSLQVHMVQHLLLMIVAPPLLLYGAPTLPMIAGLPKGLRDEWITPFATWRPLRDVFAALFHPATAWCLFVASLWIWHVPTFYDLALQSDGWHRIEHACFLLTSILFWWPVMRPYPFRSTYSPFWLIPYMFLAGVQGTALAGILTFSDQVLYTNYQAAPSLWGLNPLIDQAIAGAIMWVPMSLAFLVALVHVVGRLMSGTSTLKKRSNSDIIRAVATRDELSREANLPKRPSVARNRWKAKMPRRSPAHWLFRSARTRWMLRAAMFALAVLVIVDGIMGPQVSPLNIAGVLPWIHWRGILVLTLLMGGNFFCMACPFTSLQKSVTWIAKTLRVPVPRRRSWPHSLRNKWLAIVVLGIFFWSYEAFALWDRPYWTAMIALGFFVVAVVFELLFDNASFCKFVCPIGQFNFVQSLVSPTEIAVANPDVCSHCVGKDCIAGNTQSRGCQTFLFQPRKQGNMDCTFCFDCVDACPHENVALVSIGRTRDLVSNRSRSSVRRYSERPDLAAMILFLFFASLVNAAWMTQPVLVTQDRMVAWLGVGRLPVMTVGLVAALIVFPYFIITSIAKPSEIVRFAPALVPLGFGMWLAHYSFHLFTSADAVLIAGARMWGDWTGDSFSAGAISCACCRADSIAWLLPLELVFLGVGLCLSFVVAYRIANRDAGQSVAVWRSLTPWFVLMLLFYFSCVWVLLQPMQMRGAGMSGVLTSGI